MLGVGLTITEVGGGSRVMVGRGLLAGGAGSDSDLAGHGCVA